MTKAPPLAVLVVTQLLLASVNAFCYISSRPLCRVSHLLRRRTQQSRVFTTKDDDSNASSSSSSSYESSASVTKGLVSSLTSLTNNIIGGTSSNKERRSDVAPLVCSTPPTSPEELLTRIQKEYTQNNYLWTGNIDTSSFEPNCRFTDPTLSFVGVDKYVQNVGNLVPIVEYALGDEQISNSTLLDITLDEDKGYIQTRWNMIGELNALFWKPKIDVIGRTKFWYQQQEEEEMNGNDSVRTAVQVYFYDEEWEIPAGLALLQLVTPAGTIRRSDEER